MIYDPKKIQSLRLGRGFSMTELARRAGIKQPSLWALEHGKTKRPKFETLAGIALALGVPVQEILAQTTPKSHQNGHHELLAEFQALDAQNQIAVRAMIKALLEQGKRR